MKQIDGLQGSWTFLLFAFRSFNFHMVEYPPLWYESVCDFDSLLEEAFIQQVASSWGVFEDHGFSNPMMSDVGTIAISVDMYDSVFNASEGRVPPPSDDDKFIGSHVLPIVGLTADLDLVWDARAWAGWSEDGTGVVDRSYIEAHATDIWMARRYDHGFRYVGAQAKIRELAQVGDGSGAILFLHPQRTVTSQPIADADEWRFYPAASWQFDAHAEIIELILDGALASSALVVYTAPAAIVMDIFTWPPFRRRGFASRVLSQVEERSRGRGAQILDVWVHRADLAAGTQEQRAFLGAEGYELLDVKPAPSLGFTGRKKIAESRPKSD